VTQARTTPQPQPDDDWPPLPAERTLPPVPGDEILKLDEADPPTLPVSEVPQTPDEPELPEPEATI
jgi:hypothetical protein